MIRHLLIASIVAVGVAAGCSAAPAESDEPATQPMEEAPAEDSSEDAAGDSVEAATEEAAPEPTAGAESAAGVDLTQMPADDTANGLAARIAKAHGVEAFDASSQATFTFVVVDAGTDLFASKVTWDKESNRARVSWRDKKAKADVVAMVHLDDPTKGWVRLNDEPATEPQRELYLEAAYGRWVNDAYWAFMPQKVIDPGVTRELEEDRELDGESKRVLKLTYDGVGLTPGDTYWVWVDPETYRVEKWEMLLEGAPEDAEPTPVLWLDYKDVSGVLVSHDHEIVGTPRRIQIRDVAIANEVDESLFDEP